MDVAVAGLVHPRDQRPAQPLAAMIGMDEQGAGRVVAVVDQHPVADQIVLIGQPVARTLQQRDRLLDREVAGGGAVAEAVRMLQCGQLLVVQRRPAVDLLGLAGRLHHVVGEGPVQLEGGLDSRDAALFGPHPCAYGR